MTRIVKESRRDRLMEQIARVHARLDAAPGLRPVGEGEARLFAAHDLASLAEVAFGEVVDPLRLTDAAIEDLARRLAYPLREEDPYRRRYLITRADRPVGTVAVDDYPIGPDELQLSSLYLRPDARTLGVGGATVDTVRRAATAEGLGGVRLTADWLRPQSIRSYLHLGFLVSHWKHAIHMVWRRRSVRLRYRAVGAERRLLAEVELVGTEQPLLTATRSGPWLRLEQHPLDAHLREAHPGLEQDALSTMAVHLALDGYPLIRDRARWEEGYRWSEGGEPEGLARRIWFFEEYARRCGHQVDTPVRELPPGLSWPTWD
ncbi:GNAT family N-acetyltransferase [Streptacidiphilus fuscans]|uniref:GNAT family N-acetyltransferase n=1 Tax=Streptacidiphilus fuscans TaxID=2789292 RepID=A0A931AY76_9ACTN|nr:GNAT family N-acetyltransferase [Streptacidiphilus fuscans]MBF9067720.1 GNAT family N-acetyltransferase [Streptacidiphilus fuscans]